MRAYAVRRLLMVIPTLFLVTVLVFLSVRFLPGDIIDVMQMQMERSWSRLGHEEIDRAAIERRLGLDVPVYVQYGRWVGGIFLRGTLGQSLLGGDTVEQSIAQRLPVTIQLGLMAIVIGLVIAVPVGIYSAIRQDTAGDYVGRSLAILGLATPNFWLATMVIVFPAIWWRWSPPLVLVSFAEDPLGSLAGFAIPLSREGRQYMEIAPRLAVWSGLCLTVVVYCLNMVGDAVRDLLDPRLRGGSGRLGAYGAQAVRTAGSTAPPART